MQENISTTKSIVKHRSCARLEGTYKRTFIKECDVHVLHLHALLRRNRAKMIQNLKRPIKCDLPDAIKKKLNNSEYEYFEHRSATLQSHMPDLLDLDLDLAVFSTVFMLNRVTWKSSRVDLVLWSTQKSGHEIYVSGSFIY
ncbi:hypothetical protein QVD17_25912 [Tagetes erecta]|uniref:Uncharacterized protein n=1 Tax=Tagetes erecta TaxID=13708 RepID=A0AAD8K5H4_TARER|nr:hypothetical protein QVD17_25912 [Tagetes erecta]